MSEPLPDEAEDVVLPRLRVLRFVGCWFVDDQRVARLTAPALVSREIDAS